jgi:hypothetical protein
MKSKFSAAKWRVVFCGLLNAAVALSLLAGEEVTGRVTTASGTPLQGATVFVYTAAPKTGTSALCPSCYPDCGKTAQSNAAGNYSLAGLSSELVFRLLVVAKGHAPKFVARVERGQPTIEVTLEPRQNADAPNVKVARGRIVDINRMPILGAVLEIDGMALDGGRQQFGGLRDTDPLAVTDENGEFVLTSGQPALALLGRISARGFANQSVYLATDKAHTLVMTEGATLSGRVMLDGKPVPHVALGLSPQDRRAGSFVGNFEVGTDAEGRFTFVNLPPKTDYDLYGKMETVGRHGATALRPVHVGRDGTKTDIGDLPVQAARRLSGRVVLADGEKLPEKSRLLIGRDRVSDLLSVDLGAEGEFDVKGIPPGVVTLSTRIPGYRVSEKNQSYDAANRRLVGQVTTDILGLEMLLEKSEPNSRVMLASDLPRPKAGERPQERPLRGAESALK